MKTVKDKGKVWGSGPEGFGVFQIFRMEKFAGEWYNNTIYRMRWPEQALKMGAPCYLRLELVEDSEDEGCKKIL